MARKANIFRGSGYQKHVLLGKRTVKEGECCAVWDDTGKQTLVVGPKRIWIWKSTVRFVDRHFADQQQYLVIRHKSGEREHVRGPITKFEDPVLYDQISVHDGLHVNNYEVIVVYREETEDKVQRRIIHGPTLFIPAANEWTHKFSWHGADPSNKTKVIPNAMVFEKLPIIPDQIYYNISDVRTSDDAQITVKLMIFYEIKDIEKMLDKTHDPIADIINAVCADVIQKCSSMTYEQFIMSTASFNALESYQGVLKMAETVGFNIPSIVYRGYQASDKLQAMHDAAIQSRTKLHNEAEMAEQVEKLEDMKLSKKLERLMREMQIEESAKEHQLKMGALERREKLKLEEEELNMREAAKKKANDEQLRYYQGLKDVGVDISAFLCSQNQRIDKRIQIEGFSTQGDAAQPKVPPVILNIDRE